MALAIQHKRNQNQGVSPSASDIEQGEIAINLADLRLFTKDHTDAIKQIGGENVTGDLSFTKGDGTNQTLSVTGFKLNFTKSDGTLTNFNLFQPIMMFSLLQGNYVSGSIYNSHTHDFTDAGGGTVTVTFDNDTAISVSGGGGSSTTSVTSQQA